MSSRVPGGLYVLPPYKSSDENDEFWDSIRKLLEDYDCRCQECKYFIGAMQFDECGVLVPDLEGKGHCSFEDEEVHGDDRACIYFESDSFSQILKSIDEQGI